MKTQACIKSAFAIATLVLSATVHAHGDHTTTDNLDKTRIGQVFYDSPAYNRGIHSYPYLVPPVPFEKGHWLYIDKSEGQAIYSYPRNTEE